MTTLLLPTGRSIAAAAAGSSAAGRCVTAQAHAPPFPPSGRRRGKRGRLLPFPTLARRVAGEWAGPGWLLFHLPFLPGRMRVQRAAPLFPKILYGWWAQMLPPGGRQDGAATSGRNRRLRPSSLDCHSVPRGSPSFNTNILSTTVRENHIEIPASVHRASLGTEGTAAHGKKSQGPRGGLGQTKEEPGTARPAPVAKGEGRERAGRSVCPGKATAEPGRRPGLGEARRDGATGRCRRTGRPPKREPGRQVGLRRGLWTGGRRRLSLPGFCAEHTGTAFRELDVDGAELPGQNWNPEPSVAVTRQLAGRREARTRSSQGLPAHVRSSSARFPSKSPTAEWEGRACARVLLGSSAQPGSRSRSVHLLASGVQD